MRYFRVFAALALSMTSSGCLPGPDQCVPARRYASQTHYTVDADEVTPKGVQVDRSGQSYPSLEMVDRLVDDVESCLVEQYGDPPALPQEVMDAYDCPSATFPFPFARECLTVKVPNDWFISHDGTQELLPFGASPVLCLQKLKLKDPDATLEDISVCFWRAGLQCSNTIVSTPSMYVFKDPLIRTTTGCNNPWGVRIRADGTFDNPGGALPPALRLSNCASPGTSEVPARSPLPERTYTEGFTGYQVDTAKTGCGY